MLQTWSQRVHLFCFVCGMGGKVGLSSKSKLTYAIKPPQYLVLCLHSNNVCPNSIPFCIPLPYLPFVFNDFTLHVSIIIIRRFTVSLSALAATLDGKKSATLYINEGHHWDCESKTLLAEQSWIPEFPYP